MIRIEKLTKHFVRNERDFEAVHALDLHIPKGAFVGIIGHSGSGKTTLFNLLAGLARPTSGSLFVDGVDVGALSEKKLAEYRNQTVGYILQGHSMLNNFTILDNICMPGYIRGAEEEVQARGLELLEEIGLAELAREHPENLSGGELRRVAIARAMINRPPVILADEPTSNLDPDNARRVMELLKRFNAQGTTVLISTHELEYLQGTDAVYEMEKGVLTQKE